MTIEKIFLGWCEGEGPAAVTARALLESAPTAADGAADLSSSMIVVSSGRIMRHLRYELLTQARTRRVALIPPLMCTIETLGSRTLGSLNLGASISQECVSSSDWLVALEQALGELSRDAAELLAPRGLPQNPKSRITLVQQLQKIIDQATSANRSPGEIAMLPIVEDSASAQRRWKSLQELVDIAQGKVQAIGDRRPLCALDWNRRLVEEGVVASDSSKIMHVILLGVLDATPLTRAVIARLESQGVSLAAWIIAPEDHAKSDDAEKTWFDEIGCVRRGALRQGPELRDDQIEPADGPEDQCEAAVARYAMISQKVSPDSPDPGSIVIINGDPELNAVLGRTIEAHGRSIHVGRGKSFSQTLAGKLLGALSAVNASPHPDSLAAFVEHPCVTHYARRNGATFDLVSELDSARVGSLVNDFEHLESLGNGFREAKGSALMSQLRTLFGRFIPQTMGAKVSGSWAELTDELVRIIRRNVQGTIGDPAQEAACDAMDHVARQIAAGVWADQPTTVGAAVAFLDSMLRDVDVPIAPDGFEIEVIGWLDSLFDPSSSMILMGIREGTIPSTPIPDGWLNDSLRKELGLADRSQRLARDAYVLHAIAARTKQLVILSGLTNADGEPGIPSRLLFPGQGVQQAQRVRRLFDQGAGSRLRPQAIANSKASKFFEKPVPENYVHLPLPGKTSVTGFKAYIESPYGYWIESVLGLGNSCAGVGSGILSLDPLQFGTLLHETLARLIDPKIKDCEDPKILQEFLSQWIRAKVAQRYGKHPKAGIILQVDLAIERIESAIEWHLADRAKGWILQAAEWSFPKDMHIDVDGVPHGISGRIDRIDRHHTTGEWRIIDYKSGDNEADPNTATQKKGELLDLQLPLYRNFAPQHYPGMSGAVPTVGYVALPAAPDAASFLPLELEIAWDAIALDAAQDIIRKIRNREFGSADDFSTRDDGYARLLRQVCFTPAGDTEETPADGAGS